MILQHGDFGLGTFENVDGEMVVLDGNIYQIQGDGKVSEAPGDAEAPFAVVTRFVPQVDLEIAPIRSLSELEKLCDQCRSSNNIFYAFRLDGLFDQVNTRTVSPPRDHGRLVDAAKEQAEFKFSQAKGTLVGLWSPGFSSAISISGYHFHFLSDDRLRGGHLLACAAGPLRLRMQAMAAVESALHKNPAKGRAYAPSATAPRTSMLQLRLVMRAIRLFPLRAS